MVLGDFYSLIPKPNRHALVGTLASASSGNSIVRVPAAYPTAALLAFLAYLALHKINNLRVFNTGTEFDSHPGHHFFVSFEDVMPARTFCTIESRAEGRSIFA